MGRKTLQNQLNDLVSIHLSVITLNWSQLTNKRLKLADRITEENLFFLSNTLHH